MTTGTTTSVSRLAALLLPALVALAVLAACGDEDQDAGLETEFRVDVLEVIVHDDRIEPSTVSLRTPDKVTLDVTNRSDTPCTFNLGEYVRDLRVAPGAQREIAFTVIDVDSNISPGATAMGCAEDETRQGTLEILDATAR